MNDSVVTGLASVLAAAVTAIAFFLVTRKRTNLGDMQAQYDQMQEDLAAERAARMSDRNEFRTEITGLRIEMVGLRAEVRMRDDYIGQLRQHINDRKDPPPPEWPWALTGQHPAIGGQ